MENIFSSNSVKESIAVRALKKSSNSVDVLIYSFLARLIFQVFYYNIFCIDLVEAIYDANAKENLQKLPTSYNERCAVKYIAIVVSYFI